MKRITILALLPVFLFSIIGWQWMFLSKLNDHQSREWVSQYDEEELEIIKVKIDDTKNCDTYLVNDHELFHHGKYFDIKYKKRRGDEIVFYCHPDHEEEGLFASLDQQVKDAAGTTGWSKQKLLKVVKVSVFENETANILFDQNEIGDVAFQFDILVNTFLRYNPFFVPPDAGTVIS